MGMGDRKKLNNKFTRKTHTARGLNAYPNARYAASHPLNTHVRAVVRKPVL